MLPIGQGQVGTDNLKFNLADYVLTNGPVIQDGNTVGVDARQRIRVAYTASAFGHPGQVMRLEHQNAPGKRPWWRRP